MELPATPLLSYLLHVVVELLLQVEEAEEMPHDARRELFGGELGNLRARHARERGGGDRL